MCLAFVVMSFVFGVSGQAQQADGEKGDVADAAKENVSRIVGIVTDMEGAPLVDAKVRVVIPQTDLRFTVDPGKHREFWGQTDPTGSYSIKIDGIDQVSTASVDILHRGHRRLVGTLMSGGSPNEAKLAPGKVVEFDAQLPEAMYFAGQVVGESGEPIEGILVASSLNTPRASAGVERTVTDEQGRFAVFSYEDQFFDEQMFGGGDLPKASLYFKHDRYIDNALRDIASLEIADRDDIRIVMKSGHSIAGVFRDPKGAPTSDLLVSLTQVSSRQRKAIRTDKQGRFRFDGLSDGDSTLRVVDVGGNRKSIQRLKIESSDTEMSVLLEPIEPPLAIEFGVLKMTLTDVTAAINKAYELDRGNSDGVMIVDPGEHAAELEVGELRPGCVFWMVGNDRVGDLRTMVDCLVREATAPSIPPGGNGNTSAWIEKDGTAKVRVVYSFDSERGRGTNTQYMRLAPEDIAELVALRERLEKTE